MPYRHEVLVEVFRITEMRDDAIYKTELVEMKWVEMGAKPPEGYLYVSVSTGWQRLHPGAPLMRSVKVD